MKILIVLDDVFLNPLKKEYEMTDNNYDLLDDNGSVPVETRIKSGTVVIGKVSPIKSENDKLYKDSSIVYKSGNDGVVDKINNNKDNDGYDLRVVKIRSQRPIVIGDKICSRHGQKEHVV